MKIYEEIKFMNNQEFLEQIAVYLIVGAFVIIPILGLLKALFTL
jgi:hypothetical protein|tara:strand:- start:332 stop:463 length:132 start_codon:yes stop_codon:yes gene_type:complete